MTTPETATRFDGLANIYDRHRPDYPAAALAFLRDHCGFAPGKVAVDVGCGTGISSRQLAATGWTVIGVEPNGQMRAVAEAAGSGASFRDGRAEATGLSDESADLVVAAQAFHWFQPVPALAEFHRIVKPGGWVALMWNEQDRDDPLTAAYSHALKRFSPTPDIAGQTQCAAGDPLLTHPLFHDADRVQFPHSQSVDFHALLGRAFSASFAPKEPEPRQNLTAALQEAFDRHQADGRVILQYQTTIFVARR